MSQFQEYYEDKKNSLYVGNLDRQCTEDLIRQIFSTVGTVVRCKMIHASTGADPYCFVEFDSKEQAEHAMNTMNGRKVLEKAIKVNWATSNTGMRKDTSNHYHIFVGDLSPKIDTKELYLAFQVFGEISDARVVKDNTTGKTKGYGFVSFVKKECAQKAINEMQGKLLGDRNLRTGWASRRPPTQGGGGGPAKPMDRNEISAQASPRNTTVYVGNLPYNITDDILRANFVHFGEIFDIKLFPDKGYAFVKYYSHDQATEAIFRTNQKLKIEENTIKCYWGKENTEMNHSMQWQQAQQQYWMYHQYYQQQQQQQPQQQQQYVQYTPAQYMYYPQQQPAYGAQPVQVVQMQTGPYSGQMGTGAAAVGQQGQTQQMVGVQPGMMGPQGGAAAAATPYALQPAAGYQTQ